MTKTFLEDVVEGLSRPQKKIPSKYFYDERGSHLFEEITRLDEYYLTRAELDIMSRHAREMAEHIGPRCMLIEYGSGSGKKTRLLLDELKTPSGYVPVDISKDHLEITVKKLAQAYPNIEILPVSADFTRRINLPSLSKPFRRKVVYFPGSTIGNLSPSESVSFLRGVALLCGTGGGLLIGVDLKKDAGVLEAAYNDGKGITRDFNLNILVHINRKLGANFRVGDFRHRAFYNEEEGRIEMSLICGQAQTVKLDGAAFLIEKGEAILTEYSYKYSLEGFRDMARKAGWDMEALWTDPDGFFAVSYLKVS